ncbi:MAG TPA: DUF222 domain-containing protein [Mycobacterium sp.]|jgi:hypothetical protein|nr:DUF222 domain-containing protein [Mycobacterium sp.]
MSSSKQQIIAALDAAEASYRALAALPLEALTRPEKTELLKRLGEIDRKMVALDRRLIGQLITAGDPAMFGGTSWADVLSRRLRISPGEAQRRIAEARSAKTLSRPSA